MATDLLKAAIWKRRKRWKRERIERIEKERVFEESRMKGRQKKT